jgi:lipoprotein-anchoring transpeptidase ErfK/SrfK
MLRILLLASAASVAALASQPASAQSRYAERPPLVVSPDLSAPWVIQLKRAPDGRRVAVPTVRRQVSMQPPPRQQRRVQRAPDGVRTAAVPAPAKRQFTMDPVFLPQEVDYLTKEKAGTIVIDQESKFLYYVRGDGTARRYGVGVGKEGMAWKGTERVTNKREWPEWRPPAEMIAREKKKGRILPTMMAGGPENPLGARALYLGDTLYRIHGTNAPWTIGTSNSSGCIRMRNEDVVELYEIVGVGTKVVVQ